MMCKKLFGRFLTDERGQVLVISAALILIILGITAFTTDIGWLQSHKRHLQNTADAAALAGARDLADGKDDITVIASVYEYVNKNEVDVNEIIDIDSDGVKRVTVKLKGTRDLFFARTLGFNSANVAARATAAAGPPATMKGVLPIGISWNAYSAPEGDDGYTVVTKDTFTNEGASGNWGWVNLDYAFGENAPSGYEQAGYVINGYDEIVSIGQMIKADTGADIESVGNLRRTDLIDYLNQYISGNEVLYIPVIDVWSTGASDELEIIGFAAITLEEVSDITPSDFWLSALIDKDASIFTGGPLDPNAPDTNVKTIGLVE